MSKRKLPPATDWRARDISEWNCTTFHSYIIERHTELFGVDYVPYRGWQAEKGMLKNAITAHGNELIREFIDECLREYKPTREYPGISFGWMWAYKKTVLQRLQAEAKRKADRDSRAVNDGMTADELAEWL